MHEHAKPIPAHPRDCHQRRWTASSAFMDRRGSAAVATGLLGALLLLGVRAEQAGAAQVDPDRISDKHDGRRGAENPYLSDIGEEARTALSATRSGTVRRSRFALMAKPLDPDESPPIQPPPPPSPVDTPPTADAVSARANSRSSSGDENRDSETRQFPLAATDRPTRFDH